MQCWEIKQIIYDSLVDKEIPDAARNRNLNVITCDFLTCVLDFNGTLKCFYNIVHMNNFYSLTPPGFEEGTKCMSISNELLCAIDKHYSLMCFKLGNTGEYPFKPDTTLLAKID